MLQAKASNTSSPSLPAAMISITVAEQIQEAGCRYRKPGNALRQVVSEATVNIPLQPPEVKSRNPVIEHMPPPRFSLSLIRRKRVEDSYFIRKVLCIGHGEDKGHVDIYRFLKTAPNEKIRTKKKVAILF